MIELTSWAVVTPHGADIDTIRRRLLAGEHAARENAVFDARTYQCKLAASIPFEPASTPHDRVLRRMARHAYALAFEALESSGVDRGERLGLFAAVGGLRAQWNDMMSGLASQEPSFEDSWNRGLRKIHPFWMLKHLSNNTHALLSKELDARGDGMTFAGATAGAQAIEAAALALEFGSIDAALVVVYDSLIEPETVVELGAQGVTTHADLEAYRAPYADGASGFVPAEGAAAVVVRRGESTSLNLIGAATAADGQKGVPGRSSISAAIERTLSGDRQFVFGGSGRGDREFDRLERAVARDAGARAFTSAAAFLGQLGAAADLVGALCLSACLEAGALPPVGGPSDPENTVVGSSMGALALNAGSPGLASAVYIRKQSPQAKERP